MARSRGQSDVTLGAGHVAGIFLGVLVLCGIFFTLGYVMGHDRTSAAPNSRTSAVDAQGNLTGKETATAPTRWDFYPKKGGGRSSGAAPGLTPNSSVPAREQPAADVAPASGPVAMTTKAPHVRIDRKPPVLVAGNSGISLQVAALKNQSDALALAGFLKQKGYPAFAWGPAKDRLFRVQVGPYPSEKSAEEIKKKLEREGFKSILKK